jgi:hypothetical protein
MVFAGLAAGANRMRAADFLFQPGRTLISFKRSKMHPVSAAA